MASAGGGSHGAQSRTQEAGGLSRLEKGALLPCPRGRRESRPALGILTARPPDKTRAPSRQPAEPLGKAHCVPRRRPRGSQGPLPMPEPERTLPPRPRHDLARARPPDSTRQGQQASRPEGSSREEEVWRLLRAPTPNALQSLQCPSHPSPGRAHTLSGPHRPSPTAWRETAKRGVSAKLAREAGAREVPEHRSGSRVLRRRGSVPTRPKPRALFLWRHTHSPGLTHPHPSSKHLREWLLPTPCKDSGCGGGLPCTQGS